MTDVHQPAHGYIASTVELGIHSSVEPSANTRSHGYVRQLGFPGDRNAPRFTAVCMTEFAQRAQPTQRALWRTEYDRALVGWNLPRDVASVVRPTA